MNSIKKGFGLVEVIVGVTIITISVLSIFTVFQRSLSLSGASLQKAQASFLVEEGVEVLKLLRDDSWTNNILGIPMDTKYYLSFNQSSGWSTTTVQEIIDNEFYRYFELENVFRDNATSDISTTGTVDADTKKVTVTVEWSRNNATSTESITTYITNLFDS